MIYKMIFVFILSMFVISCSDDDDGGGGGNRIIVSSGLKIFVTSEMHVGNFADDPLLSGSSSIEKLDDFCSSSSNRPNNSQYKALIVDGINRDAVSLTNWVLQPNTTYYRPYGNVEIGTTIDSAIFPVLFANLTNSIVAPSDDHGVIAQDYVWTGIGDVSNFAAGDSCNLWSDHSSSFSGVIGIAQEKDRAAFNPVNITGSTCNGEHHVYCVEQP